MDKVVIDHKTRTRFVSRCYKRCLWGVEKGANPALRQTIRRIMRGTEQYKRRQGDAQAKRACHALGFLFGIVRRRDISVALIERGASDTSWQIRRLRSASTMKGSPRPDIPVIRPDFGRGAG